MKAPLRILHGPWERYQERLQTNPLQTKAMTSACIGACGEVVAHLLKKQSIQSISIRRILAFSIFGGAITAPIMHYWYGFLESLRHKSEKLTAMQKLFLDRLILTPPFVALTIVILGVLNGLSMQAAKDNLRAVYLKTLVMNWKVWTLTQWISFNYIPPHLRVLWGNGVALWWNCYLSLSA